MELGRLGVWFGTEAMTAPEAAGFAQQVESLGYSALWIPETVGREPMAHCSWLLAGTTDLIVATGIANIHFRDGATAAQGQRTLAEQSGGRFLLGLGVSHIPLVEGFRGHDYGKPLTAMREYLDKLGDALYLAPPPPEDPPTVIAALGPKMLGLAAEKCQGAHPYFVTPEHTAMARDVLGPEPWLCVEQKVVLETDPAAAREVCRRNARIYMDLPNYRNNWKRLGFTEADLDDGGSDRFIDATFAWGDEEAISARVEEHFAAGATHVCIQPFDLETMGRPDLRALEALAPGAAS